MLVDSHCHLSSEEVYSRLDDVMNRAAGAGVDYMLNAGGLFDELPLQLEICRKYPNVFTLTGVHPHNATAYAGITAEDVLKNTEGSIELMKSLDADFYFTQEVDIDSTRSYHINQSNMIVEAFPQYGNIFTNNFHSPFLCYPLTDPHGAVEAGTETLSRYYIESSIRRSLPISEGFLEKFFDLDRCLTVNYLPLEGQENYLVLINLHLSAYDEGGVYRAKQIAMLNEILKTERDNGNYVIAGGDFNHDIADSSTYFKTTQKVPSWLAFISDDDLTEGYRFADANNNAPTCRGADMIYIKDETYTCVVDGFIVSDNIEINLVENVDNQFLYSDHNPVYMEFTLQK